MEVSKRALGLLATMAIVLTAWLVARDSASGNPQLRARSRERIAAIALADSVSRLGRLVRAREVRSLVEASNERQPQLEHASVLVIGGGLADTLAPLTDSLLATLELPAAAHVPLRLVLVEAPRQWPAHRAYVHTLTLLPDSTQDSGCTAVRVVWADRSEAEEERLDWQRLPWHGAVGPCWYLAQFGMPGPAIRTWLDARYWDVAGVVPPRARREDYRSSLEYSPGLIGQLLGDLGSGYFGGSATLVSCASDRPSLCEATLLDSPYRVGLLPEGIAGAGFWLNASARQPYSWLIDVPSWASQGLLSMMVEDLGPTRFASFWTSRAPVAEAFAAAAGMPFAEWYRSQLRREMQQAGVAPPAEQVWWPSAVGLLALALGASLRHAKRRQVR